MKNKISPNELNALKIRPRYSAFEIVKKIRFNEGSYSDRVDLELTPYLKDPIRMIAKKGVHWIILIAPTQSGKTLFLQIFVADAIDQNPGNLMYVMPTGETAARAFEDKIHSLILSTPELRTYTREPMRTCLTTEIVRLTNMRIHAVASNSLAQLSSITANTALLDEVRLFNLTIGNESNAVKLIKDRLTVFLEDGRGQGAMVSSPSQEGDLLHSQTTNAHAIVFYWYTECPECHKMQQLNFYENMKDPTPGGEGQLCEKCYCIYCQHEFDDSHQKKKLNSLARYNIDGLNGTLSTDEVWNNPFKNLKKQVVFWYTSMNSPFRSFKTIYEEYIDCKDKYYELINFEQSWLAMFRKNQVSVSTPVLLLSKKNTFAKGIVPSWCKIITAGVDSQDYEFYYVVRAWGSDSYSHLIDFGTIESNKHLDSPQTVHNLFLNYFENKIYLSETGKEWSIGLWGIDSGGHRTFQIYDACKGFYKHVLFKGANISTNIRFNPSSSLYLIDKDIYLDSTDKACLGEHWSLNSDVTSFYLNQYSNVHKQEITNKRTGRKESFWKSTGADHYRDAEVYCSAVLDILLMPQRIKPRNELNNVNFSYNPLFHIISQTPLKEDISSEENTSIREDYKDWDRSDRRVI